MPPAISIDTREIDRYLGLLNTEGLAVVESELRIALDAVLEYLQMLVVDKTPVNTGVLRGSIYTEVRGVTVNNSGVAVSGLVSSNDFEPKVTAMEYGRPAGKMPPIEAIALWVKRKGLETDDKAIQRAAFLIARAIAQGRSRHQKKGGDKMFTQAAEKGQAYTDQAFDQALTQILARWSAL